MVHSSNNAFLGFAFVVLVGAAFFVAGPDRVISGLVVGNEIYFEAPPRIVASGDLQGPAGTVCSPNYFVFQVFDTSIRDGTRTFQKVRNTYGDLGACYQLVSESDVSSVQLDEAPSPFTPASPAVSTATDSTTAKTSTSGLTLYTMNKYGFYKRAADQLKPSKDFEDFAAFLNSKRGESAVLKEDVLVTSSAGCETSKTGACQHTKGPGFTLKLVPGQGDASGELFIAIHNPVVQALTSSSTATSQTTVEVKADKTPEFTEATLLVLESLMREETVLTPLKAAFDKKECEVKSKTPLELSVSCSADFKLSTASTPEAKTLSENEKVRIDKLHSPGLANLKIDAKTGKLILEFTLKDPCAKAGECQYSLKIGGVEVISKKELPLKSTGERKISYGDVKGQEKVGKLQASDTKAVLTIYRKDAENKDAEKKEVEFKAETTVSVTPKPKAEPSTPPAQTNPPAAGVTGSDIPYDCGNTVDTTGLSCMAESKCVSSTIKRNHCGSGAQVCCRANACVVAGNTCYSKLNVDQSRVTCQQINLEGCNSDQVCCKTTTGGSPPVATACSSVGSGYVCTAGTHYCVYGSVQSSQTRFSDCSAIQVCCIAIPGGITRTEFCAQFNPQTCNTKPGCSYHQAVSGCVYAFTRGNDPSNGACTREHPNCNAYSNNEELCRTQYVPRPGGAPLYPGDQGVSCCKFISSPGGCTPTAS